MNKSFDKFERIVRASSVYSYALRREFQGRNLHIRIQQASGKLFSDGHFTEATFAALKLIEEEVQDISNLTEMGQQLMMKAFDRQNAPPIIKLNNLTTTSDENEQDGYRFIFAGIMAGIRNPRGHGSSITDTKDQCLDYLSLASLLLRKLEDATML